VLTGVDAGGVGGEQVYRYDAGTGVLLRVSIGVDGFDDDGLGGVGDARIVAPESLIGQPRRDPSMSDDGLVVFFQSPVGLAPGALNDVALNGRGESRDLAQNVYEWEADGQGVCGELEGCVYLLPDGGDVSEVSGGGSATESSVELLGTDASGDDVFFSTADQLVGQDTDSQLAFYDARVDGGFPAPVSEAGCEGVACRVGSSVPEVFEAPASEVFTGSTNLLPRVGGPSSGPPKPLTRAQKLARALKACRRDRKKRKRVVCEKRARRRYGAPHKKTTKKKGKKVAAKKAMGRGVA
jgi:hypothetical protein